MNITEDDGSCPPCPACEADNGGFPDETLTMNFLMVYQPSIVPIIAYNAEDYFNYTNGRVKINIQTVPSIPELHKEIESDAKSEAALWDAYFTNPVVLGTGSPLNGFEDLTPYIKKHRDLADWQELLMGFRKYVATFDDRILLVPLDGDVLNLFYRKDVLLHFNQTVPRTWSEYIEVAKAVHGQEYYDADSNTTQILTGTCFARKTKEVAMYWYHLVLSTMTQVEGTSTGSLFDSDDMSPLTGEAMAEMLRIHEELSKYGGAEEYTGFTHIVQNWNMNKGECVMTPFWGGMIKRSQSLGGVIRFPGKLGIAPTPGSDVVFNRQTRKLEKCTSKEQCPYAEYHFDLGFVNRAPYSANLGWGGAISKHTSQVKKDAMAHFLLWAASKEQSTKHVIPNARQPWNVTNAQDPFRTSHLDIQKWIDAGYDPVASREYVSSINVALSSDNLVVEVRFPQAGQIMDVLDQRVNEHLTKAFVDKSIAEDDLPEERLRVAEQISDEWKFIINSFDARGDTVVPALESYQQLRGVVLNEDKNYLTNVRPIGLTLMAIVFALAVGFGAWVCIKREKEVIKASQPFFLAMVLIGTVIMGSSILTMGFDDGVVSSDGCDIACMATPWLLAIGFCVTFSALSSKIRRLQLLMDSARSFRRLQVQIKDVLIPFFVLLTLNVICLSVWTGVDPLEWTRYVAGRNEDGQRASYGRCVSSGNVSIIMVSIIAAVNGFALIFALYMSARTWGMPVAFNESKYIALSMVAILQAVLIGIPLLFLSESNTTAFYLVRCILVFVICFSIQMFIFVPKAFYGDTNVAKSIRESMMTSHSGSNNISGSISGPSGLNSGSITGPSGINSGPRTHEPQVEEGQPETARATGNLSNIPEGSKESSSKVVSVEQGT